MSCAMKGDFLSNTIPAFVRDLCLLWSRAIEQRNGRSGVILVFAVVSDKGTLKLLGYMYCTGHQSPGWHCEPRS